MKTAREILKELVEWCIVNHKYGYSNAIEGALKDLETLVPKKKEMIETYFCSEDYGNGVHCPKGITDCAKCKYGTSEGLSYDLGDEYYNKAIDEMHKIYKK